MDPWTWAAHLYAATDVHGVMGCDQKKLYTSVKVTPAPVRIPIQWKLFQSFASVLGLVKNFSPCLHNKINGRERWGIYLRKVWRLQQSIDKLENKRKTEAFSQHCGFHNRIVVLKVKLWDAATWGSGKGGMWGWVLMNVYARRLPGL